MDEDYNLVEWNWIKVHKIVRILRNINKKSVSGLFRVAGHKYHGMEQVRYLQKGPDSLILKNGKFAPKLWYIAQNSSNTFKTIWENYEEIMVLSNGVFGIRKWICLHF